MINQTPLHIVMCEDDDGKVRRHAEMIHLLADHHNVYLFRIGCCIPFSNWKVIVARCYATGDFVDRPTALEHERMVSVDWENCWFMKYFAVEL